MYNMVKCKDAIKNAVREALRRAMDNIVKVTHYQYVPVMETALFLWMGEDCKCKEIACTMYTIMTTAYCPATRCK